MEHLDTIIIMLVSGIAAKDARKACIEKLGLSVSQADALITAARKKITVAADYNRAEEINKAYIRLNDIYRRSLNIQDAKTALASQKELNKLMGLYTSPQEPTVTDGGGSEVATELDAIREHLMPLALANADYPLREHARIAAGIIRDSREKSLNG